MLSSFVTRSPLNEDVFAARPKEDIPVTHEEIKDLQAKIYKLFLQVIISKDHSNIYHHFSIEKIKCLQVTNTKITLPVSVPCQFEMNPLGFF